MMENTCAQCRYLCRVPLPGCLAPNGCTYLPEDLSTERCVSKKQTGVIQHPAVGNTILLDLTHDMRKPACAPGPEDHRRAHFKMMFSYFHGFLLCNGQVVLVSY